MSLFLNRNTTIGVSSVTSGYATTNTNSFRILGGEAFNLPSSAERFNRDRISSTATRAVTPYVQTVGPVSWSFTHYVSPYSDTNIEAIAKNLWKLLSYGDSAWTGGASVSTVGFTGSNIAELPKGTIWFFQPSETYKLTDVVVNSAEINLDQGSLTTITWSGYATSLDEDPSPPVLDSTMKNDIGVTGCIRNKLTKVTLTNDVTSYDLPLLNGTISINNNIDIISQTKIGSLTRPTIFVTGKREVFGNLVFYLKAGSGKSKDLYKSIRDDYINTETPEDINTDIQLEIGIGSNANADFELDMPFSFLEIPEIAADDVWTLNASIIAKESSAGAADEIIIKYRKE